MQTAFPRPSVFPERGVPDRLISTPLDDICHPFWALSLCIVVLSSGKVPEMHGK